jgi:hypothetical protein
MWAGLDCFQNVQAPEVAKNVVILSASISFISLNLTTTLEIFLQVMKTCCESRHFSVWLEKLLWTCGLKPVKNRKISVPFPLPGILQLSSP